MTINDQIKDEKIRFDWFLLSAANLCPHPPNARFKNTGIVTNKKYRKKLS